MALPIVSDLKDSVAAILSGIDLSNVDNLNGALERAARILVQKADVPEASGIQNITLYSGVFDYACDRRIFGTAVKDIRPQGVSRPPSDYVYKRQGMQFDRTKGFLPNGTMTTFEYANGVPIIRIVSKVPMPMNVIDPMNAVGNWVLGGTASNLVQDTAVFYQSPASLRFTVTGLGTGTLTETLSSPISLSSYQGVGVAFLAIRIPTGYTASDLATISLKLGSDSADYNLVTVSQGFLGAWVSGDWLLVAFDFAGASTVGTPNWSAIQYVQVLVGTLTTMTNFRVGGLWISQPSPAQILYQSAAVFVPSGSSTATETITANTDTIVFNNPAYTIYELESALSVLKQVGGGMSDSSVGQIKADLKELYDLFRGKNPTEALNTTGNYYDDGGYGGYGGN